MTEIAYTRNYVTQKQLRLAYRELGHTSTAPEWSATLLIAPDLSMAWACRVLEPVEPGGDLPPRHLWHVIAEAGELDWPPLRPEAEIWPALLAKDPVPTGEVAERAATFFGKESIEEMHRDNLRRHYLESAHIGGIKRNATDVNFDPLVRDWAATARDLAEFVDAHRPPKCTAEQRVMEQGVRLMELEKAVVATKDSLARLMRNAAREQGDRLRHGFKADLARWSGRARPTVDTWLSDGGCCEGAVPGADCTLHPHRSLDPEEQTR